VTFLVLVEIDIYRSFGFCFFAWLAHHVKIKKAMEYPPL